MSRGFDRVSRTTVYFGDVRHEQPRRLRGRHVIAGLVMSLGVMLLYGAFSGSVVAATKPDETLKDTAGQTAAPAEAPPPSLPDMCVVHVVGETCYVQDAESGCFPDCPAGKQVVNGPPPPIRKPKVVSPPRKRAGHPKRDKPASPPPKPAAPSGPTVPA